MDIYPLIAVWKLEYVMFLINNNLQLLPNARLIARLRWKRHRSKRQVSVLWQKSYPKCIGNIRVPLLFMGRFTFILKISGKHV